MYVESAFRYRRQGREVLEVTDSGEREGVKPVSRVRHRDDRGGGVAAILDTVVTGDSIVAAMTNIIARALNTKV
jgi:hypothetical protein